MAEKLGKYGRMEHRLMVTETQIQNIVRALRAGNRMRTACELAGVMHKTVTELQRDAARAAVEQEKGRITRHEEEILDIDSRLRMAMAEAEGRAVNTIARAVADNDWRAGAWFLQYARGWTKLDVNVNAEAGQINGSWAATLKQALLGDGSAGTVPCEVVPSESADAEEAADGPIIDMVPAKVEGGSG